MDTVLKSSTLKSLLHKVALLINGKSKMFAVNSYYADKIVFFFNRRYDHRH
jgi:hypothetical protein